MHLAVMAMAMLILAHDAYWAGTAAPDGWAVVGLLLLPKLAVGGIYALACHWTFKRLATAAAARRLRELDRLTGIYRVGVVVLFSLDLYSGSLVLVRDRLGDWILLDELMVMLPTLAMFAWGWWCYYPIDRRLREASLIRQIDSGRAVYPIWTRGQYLLSQFRHQVALVLAPLLIILAWMELVNLLDLSRLSWLPVDARALLTPLGAGGVFLIAPVVIRHVWDTVPLPAGELRQRLLEMCRQHGVGVRELLLWRTFGGIVNAAVMGLFAPVRYILLTDALLDTVPTRQVEAVMAHELAHVKKQHLFWLLVAAAAAMGVLEQAWYLVADLILDAVRDHRWSYGEWLSWLTHRQTLTLLGSAAAVVCWLFVFGWISRRFERQADTFAVQHLARQQAGAPADAVSNPPAGAEPAAAAGTIDVQSTAAMVLALQAVADLNHIPANRRSWRHGSIAWRQSYLRTLIGRRIDDVPIDKQVLAIKVAGAIGLAWLIVRAAMG
jgi:STE24 endopeptidase